MIVEFAFSLATVQDVLNLPNCFDQKRLQLSKHGIVHFVVKSDD